MTRAIQILLLAVAAAAAGYARMVLGPLQEALQRSLSLSDNDVALLQGMAIALPLALGSVPMGLLADRISRRRILIFSLALALLSTVLSALAADFTLLFAARCLAGLSLPGIVVAAYSMVSDHFAPAERGRATMAVAIGEVCGAPLAFALGGALLVAVTLTPAVTISGWGLEEWRWALLWMAVLLLVVLTALLGLREPPRTEREVAKNPPLREIWPMLWRHRAVAIPLQLGRAALFIADGALYVWGAPLLARKFHLPPDRTGATLGVALLLSGLLGPLLGGPLVDFCQRRGGPSLAMKILACLALVCVPAGMFALMPDATSTSVVMGIFLILGQVIAVAALALVLIVLPSELRGLNVGVSIVVGSLFFIGLAPLAVSALSGALGGEEKIGWALAIVCGIASLTNAAVFAFSARYFSRGS